MRIGIDTRLASYRKAGISRYTLQLVEALQHLAVEDEFVILQGRKNKEPILARPNFTTRTLLTPSHHRLEQLTLPWEIRPLKLDVLHSPDFIPPFRAQTRTVITIHDLVFMLYPNFLDKDAARYYGQIDQAVLHADGIIAVSNSTKHDIMRLLGVPDNKITVIYEAASPAFRPLRTSEVAAHIQRRFELDPGFILFVSTIEPRKNLPALLRAYRELIDKYHVTAPLVIAGQKGWLFEEVFTLVTSLKLDNHVRFLGRVSSQELFWLYNTARMLVQPSIYEGFGLTPLEAMACGTPVIVSNVSALPEVVSDAGLLIDPNVPEEITVAMWRLLKDEALWNNLVEKGLKRAACFSWDKAARETLALYHSVV
ncbi:MAG: glycosyltransferase family 4 protein [Chloroflexi bacterium]|nr:glycosyltransferase family 4 protein [Chloroflexota bacterium]